MHLTPIQKERLLNRDKPEFANGKRTNDYLVREALKEFLDLEDVNLIVEKLPKEQLGKILTDESVFGLLSLSKKLISLLGPGEGTYYIVPKDGSKLKNFDNFVKISRKDKSRGMRLSNFANSLQQLSEEFKMRSLSYYNIKKLEKAQLRNPFKKISRKASYKKVEK